MPKGKGYGMKKAMKKGTKSGMSPKTGKAGQTAEMKSGKRGLAKSTVSANTMKGKKMGR